MLKILIKLVLIILVLNTLKNNRINFGKTLFKPLGHKRRRFIKFTTSLPAILSGEK